MIVVLGNGNLKSGLLLAQAQKEGGGIGVVYTRHTGDKPKQIAMQRLCKHFNMRCVAIPMYMPFEVPLAMSALLVHGAYYARGVGADTVYWGLCTHGAYRRGEEGVLDHLVRVKTLLQGQPDRYGKERNFQAQKLVDVEAPLVTITPKQIGYLARSWDVPINDTWDCENVNTAHYRTHLPSHCGQCDSCLRRHYILSHTGGDTTHYKVRPKENYVPPTGD